MAACHIKNGNWKRVIDTADKVLHFFLPVHWITSFEVAQALAKNSKNTKALFRKGKALGELGFFEKSEKMLEEVLSMNPPGTLELYSDAPRLTLMLFM